jgi:hypothetical protein
LAWRTAARRAAVEQVPVEQQRDGVVVAAAAELVFLALDAAIGAERQRGPELGFREPGLRLAGTREMRQFGDLGAVVQRRLAQFGQCARGGRDIGLHLGVLQRRLERPVQQEIEITLRLRREVLRIARLLFHLQQLGACAQHLVLGDLAVAEQRFVDAQVFLEQHHAGIDDALVAHRAQPAQVTDGDVALEPARQRLARILARAQQLALRAHRRGDRRRHQRHAQREARVLLGLAQEGDGLVLQRREARRLALLHQHFVERLVDGIEHGAERQIDGAAAIRFRITRGQSHVGEISRARFVECRAGTLDFQCLRLQGEVRSQAFTHVLVDDGGEGTRTFGDDTRLLGPRGPGQTGGNQRHAACHGSQVSSRWTHV